MSIDYENIFDIFNSKSTNLFTLELYTNIELLMRDNISNASFMRRRQVDHVQR